MTTPNKIFSVDALSVRVLENAAELARDGAQFAHTYLQETIAEKDRAVVILATGQSQIKFLDELIALGGIDWSKITFFHLDEYLGIAANHAASFRHYMREKVENRVHPGVFHYIEGDAAQPIEECDRYSQLLQAQPIDLCCLGLGENGHLAFNDPSVADFRDRHIVKLVKLELATRQQQVNQGLFSHLEAVPQYAFTVTLPLLSKARKIICLAPEKRKAAAVKAMLLGSITPTLPASFLRMQTQATLFLDKDAASSL
ncbi:glucosamine-6-phosphate deaminase [Oscillatoriales cyanobacterium USR001]|nr:glucosamine-6-phosphate deaminase [Oscillatoriales cyanobacterium USR001]